MFGFFKRKNKKAEQSEAKTEEVINESTDSPSEADNTAAEPQTDQSVSVSAKADPIQQVASEQAVETASSQSVPVDAENVSAAQTSESETQAETEVAPVQDVAAKDTAVELVAEQAHKSESKPEPVTGSEETVKPESIVEPESVVESSPVEPVPEPQAEPKKKGLFARIKAGLGRTRENLTEGLAGLFLGKKQIDDDLLEELETQLLVADVGVEATSDIIERLTDRVKRKELDDAQALYKALQDELREMLEPANKPLEINRQNSPYVILMVGVNGVGKTTTIGKLAKKYQAEGKSVMLAAGDTFRAAAVEQLQVWGERNQVPVVAQHTGADSASVIFDAIQAAKARNVDILIADTAGRLQNKSNLMEELKKVTRVMKKLDDSAPHETMLVVDAGTGQNALSQASLFDEAVGLTGITLTKLDGTAKGGIVFALAKQMEIPIRFIGVGEQADDLRPFDADQFTKALFDQSES